MNTRYILTFLLLCTVASKKVILTYSYPNGYSHIKFYQTLISKYAEAHPEAEFHHLLHIVDLPHWENYSKNLLVFGKDPVNYKAESEKAIRLCAEAPIKGMLYFTKVGYDANEEFMESGLLEKVKSLNIDMFLYDIPMQLSHFIVSETKVPHYGTLSPLPVTFPVYYYFDYSGSNLAMFGNQFTNGETFFNRLYNSLYLETTKFLSTFQQLYMCYPFWKRGHSLSKIFPNKGWVLSQHAEGFHPAYTSPSNVVSLGSVSAKPGQPIKDKALKTFLDRFESVVYVSSGTFYQVIDFNQVEEVAKQFPETGFVFSIRADFLKDYKFKATNVFAANWVPQNDLLASPKVKAFISHGGNNSTLESVYHAVPLVCIGLAIDQRNNCAYAEYRKVGRAIFYAEEVTSERLIKELKEILGNYKEYKANIQAVSKLVKSKDAHKIFEKTLEFAFEGGIERVYIPQYETLNYLQNAHYDIYFFLLACLIGVYYLLKTFVNLFRGKKVKQD